MGRALLLPPQPAAAKLLSRYIQPTASSLQLPNPIFPLLGYRNTRTGRCGGAAGSAARKLACRAAGRAGRVLLHTSPALVTVLYSVLVVRGANTQCLPLQMIISCLSLLLITNCTPPPAPQMLPEMYSKIMLRTVFSHIVLFYIAFSYRVRNWKAKYSNDGLSSGPQH